MTNIVLNPDFELGLANWTSSDTSEYAIDNTEFYNGTASLKLTTTNGLASSRSTKFTVLPNRLYTFSIAIKSTVINAEARIQQYTAADASIPLSYPAWIGVLPGPDWQVVTCTFLTSLDAAKAQVYVLIRENGSANYDAASVELISEVTPFSIGSGAGVNFRGVSSPMGMSFTKVAAGTNDITLETESVKFQLNSLTGNLRLFQTLDVYRDRATVQLPATATAISIVLQTDDKIIINNGTYDIAFYADGNVVMALPSGQQAIVTQNFTHTYNGYKDGCFTSADIDGGITCVVGYQRGTGITNSISWSGSNPSYTYTFGVGGRLAVSVFPPRPFDWKRSLDDQIIHSDIYPPTATIADWRTIANTLVLHESIWKGASPKIYTSYTPVDSAELTRVINDAHAVGMRVMLYLSADFFATTIGDGFINEVQRLRDIYHFDGVYYDGIYAYNWEYSYEIMRMTRELFPSGPIYLHESYGVPFRKNYIQVFIPALDTYANWLLKGESVAITEWTDPYLLYNARGYKVSNSIGTLKYNSMQVDGVVPSLSAVLTGLLPLNMRERMLGYPSSGIYPSSATVLSGTTWSYYRNMLATMKDANVAGKGGHTVDGTVFIMTW